MIDRPLIEDGAPSGSLSSLLTRLDLTQADPADDPSQADVFVGQSERQPWGRVYGGQVLAQALVAAQRTVDPDGRTRPVHSMHAYFLRAGDDTEPITFSVERLRDGRSFSARRVHAIQFGRPILNMAASFQIPAGGLEHSEPMPPDLPDPDDLPTLAERYPGLEDPGARRWLRERPLDLRHAAEPSYVMPSEQRLSHVQLWMRAAGAIPPEIDTPALHAAVLAYASDYSMLEPVLRRHGRVFAEPGIKMASLDHAMWFHRPARVDAWLLTHLVSPSAQGGRGLGMGRIHSADGTLIASVAQEGMIRIPA